MQRQFGRSMIEMLGVLAIIAVLSIGGIVLYRRAVNNHQANQILDDVNRFAFVILERSGLALGEIIPNGDFVESGPYQLEGYQDIEPNQFSITVSDVPKGVCEALLPKAIIEYKVRVNPSANEKGKLYDTLNTDLCLDNNFMVFYFGDTAGVCNVPDDDGPTPCTQNSDCCGGEFCAFQSPVSNSDKGEGGCISIDAFSPRTRTVTVNGVPSTWTLNVSTYNGKNLTYWSAQNWCTAQGLKPATRADVGCGTGWSVYMCSPSALQALKDKFTYAGPYWLEYFSYFPTFGYVIYIVYPYENSWRIDNRVQHSIAYALCH